MWNTLFDEKMALRMAHEHINTVRRTLYAQHLADEVQAKQSQRAEGVAQLAGSLLSRLRMPTPVIRSEPEY